MALVGNGMKLTIAADSLGLCSSTFYNRIDAIKRRTKLDPRRFHDLVELEHIAMEVLHEKAKTEEQPKKRPDLHPRNTADAPSSVRRSSGRGAEVPRPGCGQDDAESAGGNGRNEKNLWPEGKLKRLGVGDRKMIRVTKDVQELFDECRPPVGAVFEAAVFDPDSIRQRTVPFCAVEYGGKLVILRVGEYEVIGKEG